jgi:hypothetical protein
VTVADALEASAAPTFNIVSPTPRASAFTFPTNGYTPSPSPSNSPFEPDLRTLTLTPPTLAPSPDSSLPAVSAQPASSGLAPAASSHRRRRSTASDINERRPKKGDEDYIKRPENAFILFRRKCCEDRNSASGAVAAEAEESPATTVPKRQRQADLSKAISAQWRALSSAEKQYWEELAKEKKKEHAELYPNYVYRPQRVNKGKSAASASAAKGKGKSTADDKSETDGDFTVTMALAPAPSQFSGPGRHTTPPTMQQAVQIPVMPAVFPTSTPLSPTEDAPVPRIARHASSQVPVHDDINLGWSFSSSTAAFESQNVFTKPESWRPEPQVSIVGTLTCPLADVSA